MTEPTTPGRRAYLARLTDAELDALLAQNERAMDYARTPEDGVRAETDREAMLDEMQNRPTFDPRGNR